MSSETGHFSRIQAAIIEETIRESRANQKLESQRAELRKKSKPPPDPDAYPNCPTCGKQMDPIRTEPVSWVCRGCPGP